jgi:cytochrome c oxidase subunit 2
MYGRVIGMKAADYNKWYADQVRNLQGAEKDVAEQQKQLNAEQTQEGGG